VAGRLAPEGKPEKLCPKCGAPYSYISREPRGNHYYYYAVHVTNQDGKRKTRKCYLSAETYVYASSQNPGLAPITGIVDGGRYIRYLEQLLEHVVTKEEDPEKLRKVLKTLELYIKAIGRKLKRLKAEQEEEEGLTQPEIPEP